jgi:hypothetical protein
VIGAAAAAVVAGAAAVGVLGLGLYMISTSNQGFNIEKIGTQFADGYAEMMTDLTADPPRPKKAGDADWKSRLEQALAVQSGQDDSYSKGLVGTVAKECGRSAVLHDVLKATGTVDAVKAFGKEVRAKYGEDDDKRLSAIRTVLIAQVKAGGGDGIGLVGLSAGR